MEVYSVIVDTDNFNSGLMGVFHPFTKALDATVDFIKMATRQDRRCQGIEIVTSEIGESISECNKRVYFCFIYNDRRVIGDTIVIGFKVLIRYPENDQYIFKILTEYKFPFDTTFKPWD